MVESINNIGQSQNVANSNRGQNETPSRRSDASGGPDSPSRTVSDEVSISQEALDLVGAQAAAQQTRTILEEQLDAALSPNVESLEGLA